MVVVVGVGGGEMTDCLRSQNTLMQTRQQAVSMWQVLLEEGVLVHGMYVCVWKGRGMGQGGKERRVTGGLEITDRLLSQNTLMQTRQQAVGMWQVLLEEGILVHGEFGGGVGGGDKGAEVIGGGRGWR